MEANDHLREGSFHVDRVTLRILCALRGPGMGWSLLKLSDQFVSRRMDCLEVRNS
jgi:hypothetical protein